jgi:transketolase
MLPIHPANIRLWSMLGSRGTFGVAMLDSANSAEDVMVLTADLSGASGLERFRTAYPDRFLNVGIAEQNMIGIAAGLAKEGHNVFATTFSTFAAMRSYEQIRLHLGYMGFNVKVIGLAGGLAMGQFGNTHYGIEDMALMRAVPGLTVISPADGVEIVKTVDALTRYKGPVFVRLTGAMNNPVVNSADYDFEIGKACTLREGGDVAIFACGTMVHESLMAAKSLAESGIEASVTNIHTLKPLDGAAIDRAATGAVLLVTVEEHGVIGGLGGAVAEHVARRGHLAPQLSIGLPDVFGKNGDYKYLLQKYGLTALQIANQIMAVLRTQAVKGISHPLKTLVASIDANSVLPPESDGKTAFL